MALSIYDINFNNKAIELLPPEKRTPKHVGWIQALLAPFQAVRDKWFGQYRTGGTYNIWIPAIFPLGFLVQWKGVVYQAAVNNATFPAYDSTGTTVYSPGQYVIYSGSPRVCLRITSGVFVPANWTYDAPPSPNWKQYLPSPLGTNERILFNGTKLILEYALNEYFKVYGTNFRQPGLLGYYYPADTPGTPTAGDANHLLYSDIFILNNAFEIVGFNVTTFDFIPKGWVSGTSYTAGLSKVFTAGNIYLCINSNTDAVFSSINWSNLGPPPAGYILTAATVTKDIIDTADYPPWVPATYSYGQVVQVDNFIFISLINGNTDEPPSSSWFQIAGFGFNSCFLLGDNFTIYLPAAVYAKTNDGEIRNFVNKIVMAGVLYSIASY